VHKQGLPTEIDRVFELEGYCRRLWERFGAWTRNELPERSSDRASYNPLEVAEREHFRLYRKLLEQIESDDEAGMSVWASKRVVKSPRFWVDDGTTGPIVFLGLDRAATHWRVFDRALKTERAVHVALDYDPDPALESVYEATLALRSRLLDAGFVEARVEPEKGRPAGLCDADRLLFRSESGPPDSFASADGLAIRGAPEGEGAARILAREVRLLLEGDVAPVEILILYREWSDEAALALETLRDWGLPAHSEVPTPLLSEPVVSALRLAVSIPLQDWETELIVRLLRHGQFRPAWPEADRLSLARAASTIKATQVFRGHDQLLRGLGRTFNLAKTSLERERAEQASAVAERLIHVLIDLDQSRPWTGQADHLRRVAGELGMTGGVEPVLDTLWDALDDQADMLDRLARSEAPWTWAEFTTEVDAILGDLIVPTAPAPGSIRLATVDQAEGARADHVMLAGLTEGTFPAREAVERLLTLRPGERPDASSRLAFGGEMLRFLRVLGAARARVVLAYPTTDLKGQDLLRAGFLDDLLSRLSAEARSRCYLAYARLHPALIDQPELAGSAADLRIRAAALASEQGKTAELVRLSRDPAHRPALEGTSAALFALKRRLRGTPFSEFEGMLAGSAAVADLQEQFGPDFPFSPSQLETYVACPFQFFSKHVLHLKPVEEKDELDEDPSERGSHLHNILENFETLLMRQGGNQDQAQIVAILVEQLRGQALSQPSDLDLGRWEIERERLIRTIRQYREQREEYEREGEAPFRPHLLEFAFGEAGAEHPVLEISREGRTIRLRGRIDRIDVAQTPEGPRFRVIDYKSGSVPSSADVRHGEMLQLPLYAIAAQRLLFQGGATGLFDLGYWNLRKDGFKAIVFTTWDKDQEALVDHVLALVDDLRRGVFVVQSLTPGCDSFCDYRGVCRLRQVLRAEKQLSRNLLLLSAQPRRARRTGGVAKPTAGGEEP
jgi:RecB family exonuclease